MLIDFRGIKWKGLRMCVICLIFMPTVKSLITVLLQENKVFIITMVVLQLALYVHVFCRI